MFEFFKKLDRIVPFKWRMVGYLGFLLIFSSIMLKAPERIFYGAIIVAVYAFFDVMWTKIHDGIWYVPVSSFISGLIIALIANPEIIWWFYFAAPLVAVFSKQILRFPGKRHIFNPAVFSFVALSFFSPDLVSWWGVSWGKIPLVIVILAGLIILFQLKKFHQAVAFLISYLLFLTLFFIWTSDGENFFQLLIARIFDGTTLFFASVMLVEPITSTFPTKKNRIFYAASIGLLLLFTIFMVLLVSLTSGFAHTGGKEAEILSQLDPFLTALVLGNLLSYIFFVVKPFTSSTPNSTQV